MRTDMSQSEVIPLVQERLTLADVERRHILETMQRAGGNKRLAARWLDIGTTTLYRKLIEYGLHVGGEFWQNERSRER